MANSVSFGKIKEGKEKTVCPG